MVPVPPLDVEMLKDVQLPIVFVHIIVLDASDVLHDRLLGEWWVECCGQDMLLNPFTMSCFALFC
jgi:hypothetical protein